MSDDEVVNRVILNDGNPVAFVDSDGDLVSAVISINTGDEELRYTKFLDYRVVCPSCGVENWLAVGTPSGDYRCINCTWWLGPIKMGESS